jgi:hypothetical protein
MENATGDVVIEKGFLVREEIGVFCQHAIF